MNTCTTGGNTRGRVENTRASGANTRGRAENTRATGGNTRGRAANTRALQLIFVVFFWSGTIGCDIGSC